ncbi:hypothetical protein Tco_1430079 [Tanacetum coccineum]
MSFPRGSNDTEGDSMRNHQDSKAISTREGRTGHCTRTVVRHYKRNAFIVLHAGRAGQANSTLDVKGKGEAIMNEVVVSDDDKSSDHDTSKDSQDYLSKDSSEDLINFLSSRDPQWQFPKQSHEEEPKHVPMQTEKEDPLSIDVPRKTEEEDPLPIDVPMQMEEEDPLPLDIVHPLQEIASCFRDTSKMRGGRRRYKVLFNCFLDH